MIINLSIQYKDLTPDKIFPNSHMLNSENKSFKINLDPNKEIR